MIDLNLKRTINIPEGSTVSRQQYEQFLTKAAQCLAKTGTYFSDSESINSLELAHLLPFVPETMIAIYIGINDAVCNKGLVTLFLPRHGHNNVFVFAPEIYAGGKSVPDGTMDARNILSGFCPPNETWPDKWTYVMIGDASRTAQSLWAEKGYIDMIPAKFEDFTMLSDSSVSKACFFIDEGAFDHPVNASREYLKTARKRGEKKASQFEIPCGIEGETTGLVPVVLERGEKLYVAKKDFGPCAHAMSNIHPDNKEYAVINENSAVPLDLVVAKPPVSEKYARGLIPARGSADMTTDWFYRGTRVVRKPLLMGLCQG